MLVAIAYAGLVGLLGLVGMDVPSPTAQPVYDTQGDGFAAAIVPAIVILGILVIAAVWTSRRPRDFERRR